MVYQALKIAENGMMDTGSAIGLSAFNLERKIAFLELAKTYWPDMSRCCREIGIHITTFYNHMKRDVKFHEEIIAIKMAKLDEIKGVMAQEAVKPKSFLDRAMMLRAYEPETFDRAKVIKLQTQALPYQQVQDMDRLAGSAVDAEIVKQYKDRKRMRIERGGGSVKELGSGKKAGGKADGKGKV